MQIQISVAAIPWVNSSYFWRDKMCRQGVFPFCQAAPCCGFPQTQEDQHLNKNLHLRSEKSLSYKSTCPGQMSTASKPAGCLPHSRLQHLTRDTETTSVLLWLTRMFCLILYTILNNIFSEAPRCEYYNLSQGWSFTNCSTGLLHKVLIFATLQHITFKDKVLSTKSCMSSETRQS